VQVAFQASVKKTGEDVQAVDQKAGSTLEVHADAEADAPPMPPTTTALLYNTEAQTGP
jgi:hypothetical protein